MDLYKKKQKINLFRKELLSCFTVISQCHLSVLSVGFIKAKIRYLS
jgi:hypothetical protein